MTNLTDEGLRDMARELADEFRKLGRTQVSDFNDLSIDITYALKQVRDAAKRETVERCAKLAEQHTSTDGACDLSNANVEGYRTAVNQIVTAIRQMDGGK